MTEADLQMKLKKIEALFAGATFDGEREAAGEALKRMMERLEAGDFYILCPDNDVPRSLDERRILWNASDIVENRPALSRWHPDYAEAFAAFVIGE